MTPTAKWTFMVYLAGDNSLSDASDTDLAEMRTVGSNPDINVVAQVDQAGGRGAKRFRVLRGGANEDPQDLGQIDSGDPGILLDFVDWALATYPAERYA